jgi:hypothetical protein
MKKITLVLITLTFAYGCLSLWAILTTLVKHAAAHSIALPAFTNLVVGLRAGLLWLPVAVAAACVYALFRRQPTDSGPATFLAWTLSGLCLVSFPVFIAALLPIVKFMEQGR